MKSISPLRYPGGKSILYNYFKNLIKENKMQNYTYVELFAGGAGVAIALLLNDDVKNIVINDYDYCVYSFWYSVLNETDKLCNLITTTDITVAEREKQKYIYDNYKHYSTLEIGFATLFLNRTNRSGILEGGIIGGKEQKGNYKIDCRFNKQNIIDRIKNIAERRDRISLFNMDAAEFLRTQSEQLKKWSFFYLDPPYVIKGGNLYKNSFQPSDHEELANLVKKRLKNRKWLITYDKVELIEQLYNPFLIKYYDLSYTAQEKKKGSEIMIFSKNLRLPEKDIIAKGRRK